jgi:hypothetical protein
MLIIIDKATHKTWVLFGACRDLLRLFTEWKNTIELETGFKVRAGHSNNGPEFRALVAFLAPSGI